MKCKHCGCENDAKARFCSECGSFLSPIKSKGEETYHDPKSNCNSFAIIGLGLSVLSLFLSALPYQIVLSIGAFIISTIALFQIKKDGKAGKDLAIAGIIVSVLGGFINLLIYISTVRLYDRLYEKIILFLEELLYY